LISMKIGVILPTFNVERTLALALDEVSQVLNDGTSELLVIDNASTDGSLTVIKEYFSSVEVPQGSCHLKLHSTNLGYGASIKAGFDFYITRNVTHVLVLHSDAQTDNYKLFQDFQNAAIDFESDVILGSRFSDGSDISAYSPIRKYGNYFFNWLTKLTTGSYLSDAGSGMVLVPISALRKIDYSQLPEDWRFHPQLNIDLGNLGLVRIREIPMRWADSESRSSVPLIRYGISLVWLLLRAWIKSRGIGLGEPAPNRLNVKLPDENSRLLSLEEYLSVEK
jgi:glycosyltransferase involved in cell wall biosynthesis